jgi:hypothetical protein
MSGRSGAARHDDVSKSGRPCKVYDRDYLRAKRLLFRMRSPKYQNSHGLSHLVSNVHSHGHDGRYLRRASNGNGNSREDRVALAETERLVHRRCEQWEAEPSQGAQE